MKGLIFSWLQSFQPDAVLVPPVGVGFVERDEERVGGGFAANGGRMTVTGDDIGITGKAHELVHDRLNQGIGTLDEGVSTLLSGMEQFKAEGIDRLTEIFGGEMDDVIERLRLIADGENTYTNFAGADDDAKTSTKFIFKMEF